MADNPEQCSYSSSSTLLNPEGELCVGIKCKITGNRSSMQLGSKNSRMKCRRKKALHRSLNTIPCIACEGIFKSVNKYYIHYLLHHGSYVKHLRNEIKPGNKRKRISKSYRSIESRNNFIVNFCRACANRQQKTVSSTTSCTDRMSTLRDIAMKKLIVTKTDKVLCKKLKTILCKECKSVFTSYDALNSHIFSKHSNIKCYTCSECPKKFLTGSKFKEHCLLHNIERPFACDLCKLSFKNESTLKSHYRSHSNERPYQCHICDRTFGQSGTLSTHLQRHSGKTPHQCDKCGKSFAIKGDLCTHYRIHLGYKPYKCETCGQAFPRKSNYIRHLRKHTGEKPYSCIYCEKRFARSENCVEHQRIHTKERPYVCEQCGSTFADSGNFSKHRKLHRNGKQPQRRNTHGLVISLTTPPVTPKSLITSASSKVVVLGNISTRNANSFLNISPEAFESKTENIISTKQNEIVTKNQIENLTDYVSKEVHADGNNLSSLKTIQPITFQSNSLNNQGFLYLDYNSRDSTSSFTGNSHTFTKQSSLFSESSAINLSSQSPLYDSPLLEAGLESGNSSFYNRDNMTELSGLGTNNSIQLDMHNYVGIYGKGFSDTRHTLDTNSFLNDDYIIKMDHTNAPPSSSSSSS